jgi:hypothetical protein
VRGNRKERAEARAAAKAEQDRLEAEANAAKEQQKAAAAEEKRRQEAEAKAATEQQEAAARAAKEAKKLGGRRAAAAAVQTSAVIVRSPGSKSRRERGPARQTRLTRLVGLFFVLAGFAAIGLGWVGAANKDYVEGQLPYALSGGAAGLGLIVVGVGLMVMAQLRTEGRRMLDRLEEWRYLTPGADVPPPDARSAEPPIAPSPDAGRQDEPPAAAPQPTGPPAVISDDPSSWTRGSRPSARTDGAPATATARPREEQVRTG